MLCASFAQAETIPSANEQEGLSPSGYILKTIKYWNCAGGTWPDPETACDRCNGYYQPQWYAAEVFYTTENGLSAFERQYCRASSISLLANIIPYKGSYQGIPACPTGFTDAGTHTCVGTCPAGSVIVNGICVTKTYSCPTTGNWLLSADKLTCTGCYDPDQTLSEGNACVSRKDKDLGEQGCSAPQSDPPFRSE